LLKPIYISHKTPILFSLNSPYANHSFPITIPCVSILSVLSRLPINHFFLLRILHIQ
jgi:hypothetical protein